MKRILFYMSLLTCFFFFESIGHTANMPAFPGAVGFGANAVGGRGGRVIEVTNYNESGTGSFRAALEASGARIVVFTKGGTIRMSSIIKINNPYITIAGQSAPGDGITIRGAGIRIRTHNVVIRGLRFRIGDDPVGPDPGNRDAIQIENEKSPPYNIIIDHCSTSWSVDNLIGLWYPGLKDVTVSNTIVGEALYRSIHPDGPHSKGIGTGPGTDRLSLIGNLIIHNHERNPKIRVISGALVNNVIYNCAWKAIDIDSSTTAQSISIVGNLFLKGKDTNLSNKPIYIRSGVKSGTRVYVSGNETDYTTGAPYQYLTSFNPIVNVRQAWPEGFVAKPAGEVLEMIVKNVGAYPANRDSVDARLVADLQNRTGRMIDSQNDVGGWPTLNPGTTVKDTDHDGMPDSWESDRGLNPNNSADGNADRDGDGFTNVEEYLNGLFDDCTIISSKPTGLRPAN